MVRYWCESCQTWLDEDDVEETVEQAKKNTPPGTVYIHEACGSYVERADEDQAV